MTMDFDSIGSGSTPLTPANNLIIRKNVEDISSTFFIYLNRGGIKMGYSITSNRGLNSSYNVVHYTVDTLAELAIVPNRRTPGATAYIVETDEHYILDNDLKWNLVSISRAGGDGGTGGTGSGNGGGGGGEGGDATVTVPGATNSATNTIGDINVTVNCNGCSGSGSSGDTGSGGTSNGDCDCSIWEELDPNKPPTTNPPSGNDDEIIYDGGEI